MDLDWQTKLSHIRWTRLVLFMEKWLSVFIMCFFSLFDFHPLTRAAFALLLFVSWLVAHNNYHTLEDSAGLPTNHLVIRY